MTANTEMPTTRSVTTEKYHGLAMSAPSNLPVLCQVVAQVLCGPQYSAPASEQIASTASRGKAFADGVLSI